MNYAVFEPTPPECVEDIKEYIKDKVIYELGAGDGQFGKVMANLYAKKVIGIECDENLCKKYVPGPDNFEIWLGDFMQRDLNNVKVIYCFLSFIGMYNLTQKLIKENWKGTIISALYPLCDYAGKEIFTGHLVKVIHSKHLPFLIYHL